MDWYVLLTPLLLLPIVSLLVFVGCGLDDHGGLASNDPGPIMSVPVKITYFDGSLKSYVKSFEFWCSRDTFTTASVTTTTLEETNEVSLALTANFLDDPCQAVCNGKVTWASDYKGGATEDIVPSAVKQFPIDSPLVDFWLGVTKDNSGAPTQFFLT